MLGFLVGEALRDLRRAGGTAVSAVLLMALSLAALGGFWVLTVNVRLAVAAWGDRVRILMYLEREPAAADLEPLLARVRAVPGVAAVRYVGRAEALESLRVVLGGDADVVDQLPSNPLPASLEVTPAPGASMPAEAHALHARLAALPGVEDVLGTADWSERLADWQRLLATVGLGLGLVLGLAAVLTVTTATTLVLHARRHETEIMRLVGAPEIAVRLPLLLQGMVQGLLGAGLAVGTLALGRALLAPRLEPLVALTLGLSEVRFLSLAATLGLIATGTVFGAFGGWLARGRA